MTPTPHSAATQAAKEVSDWLETYHDLVIASCGTDDVEAIISRHLEPVIERAEAEKSALATQVAVMRDEEAQRVKLKAVQVLIDKNQQESDRKCREAMESIGISTHWSYAAGKTVGAMTLELVEWVKKATAHKSATELCADHPNLREYVRQLEQERDQALTQLAAADRDLARCRNAIPFAFVPEAQTGALVEDLARVYDQSKAERNAAIIRATRAEAKIAEETPPPSRRFPLCLCEGARTALVMHSDGRLTEDIAGERPVSDADAVATMRRILLPAPPTRVALETAGDEGEGT